MRKVEALNAKVDAFRQPQAAAVKQESHQTVRRLQLPQDGLSLSVGQDDGHVAMALGAYHVGELAELPPQNMSEKEEQSIEGLVLCRGGHAMPHGKLGQKAAHLIVAQLVCGPAVNKGLELAHPKAVGSQGFW